MQHVSSINDRQLLNSGTEPELLRSLDPDCSYWAGRSSGLCLLDLGVVPQSVINNYNNAAVIVFEALRGGN
jgi:hypothetical protein